MGNSLNNDRSRFLNQSARSELRPRSPKVPVKAPVHDRNFRHRIRYLQDIKPLVGPFVRGVQRHARHPVQAVIVPVAAPEVESERLVAANTDIKGLPRGERCDAIERPATDQIVHNFIFRREPLATSERQLVDPRGREYLGYVDCGRSPVRVDIIWVLDPTAFNSVPAGASDVDALRPCIGDQVGQPVVGLAVEGDLEGIVVTSAAAIVEWGWGDRNRTVGVALVVSK